MQQKTGRWCHLPAIICLKCRQEYRQRVVRLELNEGYTIYRYCSSAEKVFSSQNFIEPEGREIDRERERER